MNTLKVIQLNERKCEYQQYISKINRRFKIYEKESTYSDYAREIKKFFKISDMSELTYTMLKRIKSEDVVLYLNTYINSGKSENYVKKIRASISKLYIHLIGFSDDYEDEVGHKLFTRNPANTDGVKRVIKQGCEKNHSPKIPVITRNMIDEYIDAIRNHTSFYKPKQKIRNSLLVYLLFACGCRRSEAINITVEDVFIEEDVNYIKIKKAKGIKTRIVDIPDKLADMIYSYVDTYGLESNDYVIGSEDSNSKLVSGSVNAIIKKYDKYVSNRINPHGFRHGFALELLNNEVPIQDIGYLLGHSDEKTTRIYLSKMENKKRNMIEI